MKIIIFIILINSLIFASNQDFLIIKKIESHLYLENFEEALKEAKNAYIKFPESKKIQKAYVKCLAKNGNFLLALKNFKTFLFQEKEHDLLKEISWAVIQKGISSENYIVRIEALLGAFFTNNAKAVFALKKMMEDQNAIVRATAIKLSSFYKDEILKEKIFSLLSKEEVWFVKLEIINSIGQMKIKKADFFLKNIIKDKNSSLEEKYMAIDALCHIYDTIEIKEVKSLLKSSHQGFRILGCDLCSHFKIKEAKKDIFNLLNDPISHVKIAALNSILLFYKNILEEKEIEKIVKETYLDKDPFISIIASALGMTINLKEAQNNLKKWAFDEDRENRIFAASAISFLGKFSKDISLGILKKSKDPFVKANIALGLTGQREEIEKCKDIFYSIFKNKKERWMWQKKQNTLFSALCPSNLKHIDRIPNYPDVIDQKTQLELLSIMATLDDSRVQECIKEFLKQKNWGITGLAAILLLKEGDEVSISKLKNLLLEEDKNIKVQAALALAMIGKDKSVVSMLEKFYFEVNRDVQLIILEAIGRSQSKNSIDFLLKVLEKDPFLMVRVKVASALIQIINS